jgi:hypothetical protein
VQAYGCLGYRFARAILQHAVQRGSRNSARNQGRKQHYAETENANPIAQADPHRSEL